MPTPPPPPRTPPAPPRDDPHPAKNAAPKTREPDPPVKTVADEQRERSQEIQDKGVEAFKAEHDDRGPADRPRQVPGVANVEGGTPGRSTPEARAAQNKASP